MSAVKQITAGINQRYVVRIERRTEYEIHVDAASKQEAEVIGWAAYTRGEEKVETTGLPRMFSVVTKETDDYLRDLGR